MFTLVLPVSRVFRTKSVQVVFAYLNPTVRQLSALKPEVNTCIDGNRIVIKPSLRQPWWVGNRRLTDLRPLVAAVDITHDQIILRNIESFTTKNYKNLEILECLELWI